MSWDPINFLSCLVTVAVDLNCLLNCVRVSLLRFLFVTVYDTFRSVILYEGGVDCVQFIW